MTPFDFSGLRFFDKEGHSLPAAFSGSIEIVFVDKNNNVTSFLGVTDSSLHVTSTIKLKKNGRFLESDFIDGKLNAKINIPNKSIDCQVSVTRSSVNSTSSVQLYSIESIDATEIDNLLNEYVLPFPSVAFRSSLLFDTISTLLVETQSVYVGYEHILEAPDYYTVNVAAIPENATVIINGEQRTSIRAMEGTELTIEVSADGYYSKTIKDIADADKTITVELDAIIYCTIEVVTTPEDASCTMNGELTKTLTVQERTEVEITVSCDGYYPKTESIVAESSEHMEVQIRLDKIRTMNQFIIVYRGSPTAAYYQFNFAHNRDAVDIKVSCQVNTSKNKTFTWSEELLGLSENENLSRINFLPDGLGLDNDEYVTEITNVQVEVLKDAYETSYFYGDYEVQEIWNGYSITITSSTQNAVYTVSPKTHYEQRFQGRNMYFYDTSINVSSDPENPQFELITVDWSVSAPGYITQSGTVIMNTDYKYDIELVPETRTVLSKAKRLMKANIKRNSNPEEEITYDRVEILSLNDYLAKYNEEWADRYKLFFFIDNRKNKEFRIFTIQSDEVVWTDRVELTDELSKIDIGFLSEQEGYFEDTLYVCVIDTYDKEDETDLGKVYPIGTFRLKAEAVGEDERYRALFANFGIPDPKTYNEVFKDVDLSEAKTDNIQLNENSKKMFLSYTEIFPYIGTYKALINAVEVLGYDDIFFKEWYKTIGSDISNKGYVTYDITYKADENANIINNIPIEERVKLKKLNWLSMIYKINKELTNLPADEYGYPQTENISTYNNAELLVKLISLKEWLEKYIIGLNCRIIDVGGEGIVFERYLLNTYGSLERQNSYDSEHNLYGYAGADLSGYENAVLDSSSNAEIQFRLGDDNKRLKIPDLQYTRFIDLSDGYFDENNVYHNHTFNEDTSTNILAGGTYQFVFPFESYSARAISSDDNFSFSKYGVGEIEGSNLRIENNSIYINPYQIYQYDSSVSGMSLFKNLPIIKIERGNIRYLNKGWDKSLVYKIYPDNNQDNNISYILENVVTQEKNSVQDYVTLIPGRYDDNEEITIYPFNSDSSIVVSKNTNIQSDSSFTDEGAEHFISTDYTYGFRYSDNNSLSIPMFSILGYVAEDLPMFENLTEMTIEILDGKLLFSDEKNSRTIYINFYYDDTTRQHKIDVNTVYEIPDFSVVEYLTAENRYDNALFNNNKYDYFIEHYKANDSNVIRYSLEHKATVQEAGDFVVDLFGKDSQNNIYPVKANGYSTVFTPEIELNVYSNKESDIVIDNPQHLVDEYSEFCIYEQTHMIQNIDVSYYNIYKTDSSVSVSYNNHSYAIETPSTNDYLHLMNISDQFEAAGITKKVSSFPSFSTELMNSYWIALNRLNSSYVNQFIDYSKKEYLKSLIETEISTDGSISQFTVDSFLEYVAENKDINAFDVNVIFYNTLGGYPEIQTFGWMIGCYDLPEKYFTDAAQYQKTNEYRLYIPDKSSTSFVWANIVDAARQDARLRITDKSLDSFDKDSSVYNEDCLLRVLGDTADYMLKICENTPEKDSWDNIVNNMYIASGDVEPEDLDNTAYRYNGYPISQGSKAYNPYNVLRYNYAKYYENDVVAMLRKNLMNLADTSEFLNNIKLFMSNSNNNANMSALTFMATYMEIFYTDDSLMEVALDAAILLSREAEWGTDVSEKLAKYYKYIFEKFFNQSDLIVSASDYINDGIPSGEEGNRIMVMNQNIDLVIERGAMETLQNSLNNIINDYIEYNPDYQILINQSIYRNHYVAMIYTIYKYVFLLFFSYLISRGNILQHPVYYTGDYPAILDGVQEAIDAAKTDETIDAIDVPDPSNGVMAEIILARLNESDKTELYYTAMAYNSDVEVWYPVEYDGDDENSVSVQDSTKTNFAREYEDIRWDPLKMQFPLNYKEITSIDEASEQLTKYAYGNAIACLPQIQLDCAEIYIALTKGLYDYNKECTYPGNTSIEHYIRQEILKNENWLTITKNDSSWYAVISKTEDYVKTGDDAIDGLTTGGSLIPLIPDIRQYFNNPKYSVFIQPIWHQRVQVGVLTEFSEQYDISSGIPVSDDSTERYIYVSVESNTFISKFSIGEIVRLTFYRNSPKGDQIFESACSYRVVGYDITGQILVLKGYINESQFSDIYNPIYAKVEYAANLESVQEQIEWAKMNQTINTLSIPYTTVLGQESFYEMGLARLNPDNYEELYYTPVYYDAKTDTYRRMESASKADSDFTIYISYAHHTFVDYIVKASEIEEQPNGRTNIDIERTKRSGHIMQFVDDTFVLDVKDFDTTRSYKFWDDGYIENDVKVPSIYDSSIYKNKIPLEINLGDNVALELNIKGFDINSVSDNEYNSYWKIYKSNALDNNPKYEFTSYNKILYLNGFEKGYYDIEGFIYDKYGNTSSKYFKNAIIVK